MRLCGYIDEHGRPALGNDRGGGTANPVVGDPLDGDFEVLHDEVAVIAERLAPVHPTDVWCIGKNYAEHVREFGGETPELPVVFMKPGGCVVPDGAAVVLPACQRDGPEVDYEAELAVVIGHGPDGALCRNATAEHALDFVFGYTCANDISARHWQKRYGGGQWVRGKSFDTFCPLGPCVVTARPCFEGDEDVITDPQALDIACTLNGETRQSDTTANMIYPVAELVAFLSQDTTLWPGTVVLTGTPQGVGMASDPPRFLRDGDEVCVTIAGVGTLRNPVRDA